MDATQNSAPHALMRQILEDLREAMREIAAAEKEIRRTGKEDIA